jgi:hypothetical protein
MTMRHSTITKAAIATPIIGAARAAAFPKRKTTRIP